MRRRCYEEHGSPIPEGTVLIFAEAADHWMNDSRFVRAVPPDHQGHFQAKGLPPGGYLIVALDYVETGTWNDPEFLESLRRTATKFALAEAGSHTIALKLTSADAAK